MPIWLDKTTTAGLLGITIRHFDGAVRTKLPPDAVRGSNVKLEFDATVAVEVWVNGKVDKAKADAAAAADPMQATGVDSPGLERFRNANADIREMERDRQRAKLIDRDELEPALMQFADVLRNAGETLARLYGNEAAGVLNEATDEFVNGVEKIFKTNDRNAHEPQPDASAADGDENQDAETPHDAAVC